LGTLKAIVEAETGLPATTQAILYNGSPLASSGSLTAQGVQQGDLLMLVPASAVRQTPGPVGGGREQPAAAAGSNPTSTGAPSTSSMPMNPDGSALDPEALMAALRSSPHQLSALPPPMQNAINSGDVDAFQQQLRDISKMRQAALEEEQRFLRLAAEDPLNPEVQMKLEEAIRQKNVAENFEAALEYNPEAFGSVVMLYVNMEVNGCPLKAFVDSGAQTTIMGKNCAEKCGLMRLLDRRFEGMAIGVGKSKILGRVHMAQLTAGGKHIPISITVLEADNMDFLFGLDNMKRHLCCIDLKDNALRFPLLDVALPFLPEHEVPKHDAFNPTDAVGPGTVQGDPGSRQPTPPQHAVQRSATPGVAPASNVTSPSPQQLEPGWEEKVDRLMVLGFSREQCVRALQSTNGNEELAGSLLFGGM
jgi:DNA damage-inducible protein 1